MCSSLRDVIEAVECCGWWALYWVNLKNGTTLEHVSGQTIASCKRKLEPKELMELASLRKAWHDEDSWILTVHVPKHLVVHCSTWKALCAMFGLLAGSFCVSQMADECVEYMF